MKKERSSLGLELDNHQVKKKKRIRAVAEILRYRRKVRADKFVAELEFNGIRKSVAQEYINTLLVLELIKTDGAFLIWNESNPNI